MTNFEFYKDEILKIATDEEEDVAIVDGKPCTCGDTDCNCCDFGCDCGPKLVKWLYAEHVEKPKINKKTKEFFDTIETGWVARDKIGSLFVYADTNEPKKGDSIWLGSSTTNDMMRLKESILPFLTLDFIKWEDEEPWSVEDIRNLEVV